jgi:hypothetical protein
MKSIQQKANRTELVRIIENAVRHHQPEAPLDPDLIDAIATRVSTRLPRNTRIISPQSVSADDILRHIETREKPWIEHTADAIPYTHLNPEPPPVFKTVHETLSTKEFLTVIGFMILSAITIYFVVIGFDHTIKQLWDLIW